MLIRFDFQKKKHRSIFFFITFFCQRSSTPHKIRNRDSYSGNLPGTLGIKAYYGAGCLNVHLGKAKLFGKRSQDPYARVYLFDEITQKCYFQRENKQTDVFSKNIEPNFNKSFYFKVKYFVLYQSKPNQTTTIDGHS